MKILKFTYSKTPTDTSTREFIVLNPPNKNYFGLDITELGNDELAEVVYGVAQFDKVMKEALEQRTQWVKANGYGSYFRNFNPDKMDKIVTEDLN